MFKLKTRIKDRVKLQEILTKNPKKVMQLMLIISSVAKFQLCKRLLIITFLPLRQ